MLEKIIKGTERVGLKEIELMKRGAQTCRCSFPSQTNGGRGEIEACHFKSGGSPGPDVITSTQPGTRTLPRGRSG